jgi:RNA recognition motif-containing protein
MTPCGADWTIRPVGSSHLHVAAAASPSLSLSIVEFDTVEDAARAINELSGKEIAGRKIFIREVRVSDRLIEE